MTAWRWFRVVLAPGLMLAVAAFFLWQGVRFLIQPSLAPAWLAWFLLAMGVLKASLWTFVTVGFLRHREAVMAARGWKAH